MSDLDGFEHVQAVCLNFGEANTLMGNSKFKIVTETMAKYDASQFHPHSLNYVLNLDGKQAQAVCALHSLSGKTKVEQHLAIVDHRNT
jgi:hypothetical protein